MLKNENGMAMVLTLFIVVLMITVIFEFDFNTKLNLKMAVNFRDDQKSYYLVESAVKAGKAALTDEIVINMINRDMYGTVSVPPMPVGDGMVDGVLYDIGGRFNVNSLVKPPTASSGESGLVENPDNSQFLKNMLVAMQADGELIMEDGVGVESLVDSLVDWMDGNDDMLGDGAETSYYESLTPSYSAKNGLIDSLSELKLIKGVNSKNYKTLKNYLSVYSNVVDPRANKLNVNMASKYALMALHEDISQETAERVFEEYISNAGEFRSVLSDDTVATAVIQSGKIVYASRHYLLNGQVIVGDTTRVVTAVFDRINAGQVNLIEMLSN